MYLVVEGSLLSKENESTMKKYHYDITVSTK